MSDRLPRYCEKCGMELIKIPLNNKGSFDPMTGKKDSDDNFKLKCPRSNILDLMIHYHFGHTNIDIIDGNMYDLHEG
jgi:hypothetical protein